jgi:hypothetical protein
MTGIPYFNFPKFDRIAAELRAKGHTVFNPADKDRERHGCDVSIGNHTGDPAQAAREHGLTISVALADDLEYITKGGCEAIYFMSGWENSNGALAEFFTARACKRKFFYEGQDVPNV